MPEANDFSAAAAGLPVLTPGLLLDGRYRLEEIAGQGGMSVVWRATDMVLDHIGALKFLPTVLAMDRSALKDLRREARRARDLAHPQICRVYDYGEDPARKLAWISMEYLPGGSLAKKLKEQPRGFFEPGEIAAWVCELCEALYYAHEVAHVVHRDLKPANLLLDSRGHLRITDFGIARSVSESFTRLTAQASPATSSRTGTIPYMSPQQARGEKPRPTDDLYSLGATIFELLTAEPPFVSGDVTWQREHAPPPSMTERRRNLHKSEASVPESWERLVQRLLAKHPAHRPQTAREIIAEVRRMNSAPAEAASKTEPIPVSASAQASPAPPSPGIAPVSSKPAPSSAPLSSPARRIDPWLLALGALILIGAILGLTLAVLGGK
ncbi:MAG TPA: protein kinase [Chthoniobacteraceae bacterium]|nr:protein kinase [Chthoniobacteraceae bacterium]